MVAGRGCSSYVLSRPGYQRFLFEEAEKRGVQFQFGTPAETMEDDADRPVLLLKNGDRIEADLIVGADGMQLSNRVNSITLFQIYYGPPEMLTAHYLLY